MNHAIDWSKPLQTTEGQPVTYIRRRARDYRLGDGECRIRERRDWGAGGVDVFPHVILIGETVETCRDSGYTTCQSDFEGHNHGYLIQNVPSVPALDLTKPVQTKDGGKVVITSTNAPGPYPVTGYTAENLSETMGVDVKTWTLAGRFNQKIETDTDLVNCPPQMVKRWLNLYRKSSSAMHPTEESAVAAMKQACPSAGYIKTIEVEIPDET